MPYLTICCAAERKGNAFARMLGFVVLILVAFVVGGLPFAFGS